MISEKKNIVMDIDGTLCPIKGEHQSYDEILPYSEIVEKLRECKKAGFYVILNTARNMRSYEGNMGLILTSTAEFTMSWLTFHSMKYILEKHGRERGAFMLTITRFVPMSSFVWNMTTF